MEKKTLEVRVGKNLNGILYDRKIPQKQVAEAVGISENAVSRLVGGEKMVSAGVLEKIADYLGVTLDSLVK